MDQIKQRLIDIRRKYQRFEIATFFTLGFLFDIFTLGPIDDLSKVVVQVIFLIILGAFLLLQYVEQLGVWSPPARMTKVWEYRVDIVHFLFGSLLSAYVIFFFKSASLTRSAWFLLFLGALLILNEIPRFRSYGLKIQMILFSVCWCSLFIYLVPIFVGVINIWVFLMSIVAGLFFTTLFLYVAGNMINDSKKVLVELSPYVYSVPAVLTVLYVLKMIPPVPLSLSFGGIYHNVKKENGQYKLYSMKSWYDFWSHGDSNFLARKGDKIYCFVRIFAPAKFKHRVYLRWQLWSDKLGEYETQDRIPLAISGGREEGYRAYAFKSNYQPGSWRVEIETDDNRVLGTLKFNLEDDPTTDTRTWMIERS